MDKTIFYLIKKVPFSEDFITCLPQELIDYSTKKYTKKNLKSSLYAWHVLLKISGLDFSCIKFLQNGKPIVDGYSISLSHSKDLVFVAYSSQDNNFGIDIEYIDHNKNLDTFKKLKDFTFNTTYEFYSRWTEREAYLKTLSDKKFKDVNYNFNGITNTVKFDEDEYSFSIYADNNIKFMKVDYENYV